MYSINDKFLILKLHNCANQWLCLLNSKKKIRNGRATDSQVWAFFEALECSERIRIISESDFYMILIILLFVIILYG